MKDNNFTEILRAWQFLNMFEKVKILQRFEHEIAKNEGRDEREIVFRRNRPEKVGDNAAASFEFDKPNTLFIYDISSAIGSMGSVLHESFHADVRKFLDGERDLYVLTDIDENRFFEEERLIDLLYCICQQAGWLDVFKVCFYEEVLANKNTTLKLMKYLYDSVENISDVIELAPVYTNGILFSHFNYLNYIKMNYFDAYHAQALKLANAFAAGRYAERVKLSSPSKQSIKSGDKPLITQLDRNLEAAEKYANGALSEEGCADRIVQEMINYKGL